LVLEMNTPIPPNPENLRKLYESLPDYVEQLEQKREFRGEKRVSKSLPKNLCDICGRGYNHSYLVLKESVPEMDGHCPRCDKLLEEKYTALISGNSFAFVKSSVLEDMQGTIQKVSPKVMKAVAKHFKIEWQTKDTKPE
jgi:hypothetical protein